RIRGDRNPVARLRKVALDHLPDRRAVVDHEDQRVWHHAYPPGRMKEDGGRMKKTGPGPRAMDAVPWMGPDSSALMGRLSCIVSSFILHPFDGSGPSAPAPQARSAWR